MKCLLLLVTSLFLITSCARIPEPVGYEYSKQQKMQAVHHWNVLAKDLSNRINNELIRSDFLNTTIYVKTTCGNDSNSCEERETSEFNEGFRDLLITELVAYGIPTSAIPDNEAITVNYKVQIVRHRKNRYRTIYPGVITALTTAVTVLRNAPSMFLTIGSAAGVDFFNGTYAQKTDLEVVITTSMIFRKKYFFRSSDIYYINAEDYYHYHENNNTAETVQLTNS